MQFSLRTLILALTITAGMLGSYRLGEYRRGTREDALITSLSQQNTILLEAVAKK